MEILKTFQKFGVSKFFFKSYKSFMLKATFIWSNEIGRIVMSWSPYKTKEVW